jgi:hypothetical protein
MILLKHLSKSSTFECLLMPTIYYTGKKLEAGKKQWSCQIILFFSLNTGKNWL